MKKNGINFYITSKVNNLLRESETIEWAFRQALQTQPGYVPLVGAGRLEIVFCSEDNTKLEVYTDEIVRLAKKHLMDGGELRYVVRWVKRGARGIHLRLVPEEKRNGNDQTDVC